jgi:LacI family transcriptional regulator
MKKKLSIKDIAEQLNVSKATVSLVLNNKAKESGISKAMEKKVLRYIEKVGYRPNPMAQGLRTGKSKTIGILIEDISDSFFSTVARKFEEILGRNGYRLVIGSTENDTKVAKELIDVFRNHLVDGYIIAPPPGIESEIRTLLDDQVPVVLFDRSLPNVECDHVMINNYRSAYHAAHHLIDNGYKNIAMITLKSDQIQMEERERGYNQAVDDAGIARTVLKIKYNERKELIFQSIEKLLRTREIDAVFFATNYLAEQGLAVITKLNLSIPGEIGVVVFDDYSLFRLFKPAVTAILQPIGAICTEVANLLLEKIDGKATQSNKGIQLAADLIVRQSSSRKEHRLQC